MVTLYLFSIINEIFYLIKLKNNIVFRTSDWGRSRIWSLGCQVDPSIYTTNSHTTPNLDHEINKDKIFNNITSIFTIYLSYTIVLDKFSYYENSQSWHYYLHLQIHRVLCNTVQWFKYWSSMLFRNSYLMCFIDENILSTVGVSTGKIRVNSISK